jgi:hypothetical protein
MLKNLSFGKVSLFILVLIISEVCYAQNSPFPYSGDVIKIDSFGKADKGLPFDKPFFLERDKINTQNIQAIYLYRVKYINGKRDLFPDTRKKNSDFSADHTFETSEIIKEKNKLTLSVPALKPNKDFDILVLRGVSGENYKSVANLNKILIKGPLTWVTNNDGSRSIQPTQAMIDIFKPLKASADNYIFNHNDTTRESFPSTINEFYTEVTVNVKTFYQEATTESNLKSPSFFTKQDIQDLVKGLSYIKKEFNDIYLLEQIDHESKYSDVTYGYLAANSALGTEKDDNYSLSERINNLKVSMAFFDSLYLSLNELVILDDHTYGTIRDKAKQILSDLMYNLSYIEKRQNDINKVINAKANEAVWLMGNTQSKDMQTRGANLFTLDVGIANIWARDLDNLKAYIPKLYYGVNIHFRPIDKNAKFKYLPRKKDRDSVEKGNILAHRTIWQYLCLTAGFTIGSLDKNNFDNFFGGSSLMLGPSLRLTRSFRISAGICFLKRSTLNPLISEKKFTSGVYLSTSLDFDLLGTLGKVTGLFL